jgi:mRNA-degrading endonuclease toxin of MazEF toxin-antitoxin module
VSGRAFRSAEGWITVAGITSNVAAHSNETCFALPDWADAGLRKPSVVTSWLASISPRLVRYRIGSLSAESMNAVDKRLRTALALDS